MMKIRLEEAADGHVVPMLNVDGGCIHLGSMVDGRYAASVWCDRNLADNTEVLILVGMGDLQIIWKASQCLRERIVVYEPVKELLNHMRKTEIYAKLEGNPIIQFVDSRSELVTSLARIINDEALTHTVVAVHPGCDREPWLRDITWLRERMDQFVDDLTRTRASIYENLSAIIMNEFRNLIMMRGGIFLSRLREKWNRDVPIILVGAGPSLNINVHVLDKVKDRACIICMDSAANTLLQNGIRPHMIATIDACKIPFVFEEALSTDIPFLVAANSRSDILSRLKGKKIWCFEAHQFSREIRSEIELDPPIYPTQNGVSSLALSVALELGSKKIIFIGMDLSFSATGEDHAYGKDSYYVLNDEYEADGYYGGKVKSRYDWVIMREWIEKMCRENSDREFINATEGGVRICGTKQRKLQDIVDNMLDLSNSWRQLFEDPSIYIEETEYQTMLIRFRSELDRLTEIKEMGHDKIFFDPYYRRPPVFELLMVVMRSRSEATRRERFDRAIEVLEDFVKQINEGEKG